MRKKHCVDTCNICGSHIEVGQRVRVMFLIEQGNMMVKDTRSAFVCRECAQGIAAKMGLELQ